MKTIKISDLREEFENDMEEAIAEARTRFDSRLNGIDEIRVLDGLQLPEGVTLETYCFGSDYNEDYVGNLTLHCNKFSQLHEVRKALKAVIPDYKDEIQSITANGKQAWVYYFVKNCPVTIRITSAPSDIPKSLYPDEGCGFKTVQREVLEFSCDAKKGA